MLVLVLASWNLTLVLDDAIVARIIAAPGAVVPVNGNAQHPTPTYSMGRLLYIQRVAPRVIAWLGATL
jgi:hypothetical protein